MFKFFIEIKNRIFLLFLSWLSTFLAFYWYKLTSVLLLVFLNYNFSNEVLNYFIFTSVQEMFIIYINLCASLTQYIFYYLLFYHSVCYFSWGMFKFEYIALKNAFFFSLFISLCSLIFFQLILMPAMLNFFLSFQMKNTFGLFFEAKLSEFVLFYSTTFKSCFLTFQFCCVLVLLTNYITLTNKVLKFLRKFLYLAMLFLSTLLTPPDVYSQLISFLCFISCFEFFVFKNFLKTKLIQIS